MTFKLPHFVTCVLFTVGLAFPQASSQQISGIVRDPSGLAVASANVTVRNTATGFERAAAVNESGAYAVTGISIGLYDIEM